MRDTPLPVSPGAADPGAVVGPPGAVQSAPPSGQPAAPAAPDRRGGGRWGTLASALFALVGLLGAAVTVGYASGVLPPGAERPGVGQTPPGPLANAGPGATVGGPGPASSAPTAGPAAGSPPSGRVVIADPLTRSGLWSPRTDQRHRVGCEFDGGLVVSKQSDGPYRCPGPQRVWTDVRAEVDVILVEPVSCAGIWFRFTDDQGGFVLRICADGYHLMRHGPDAALEAGDFPFPLDRRPNGRIRVGVVADGEDLRFYQDGRQIGAARDDAPVAGRVVLGIFSDPTSDPGQEPSYRVAFGDVEIATLD
ncbi:hypothetical protein [Plantactinospora veratri]